MENQLFLNSPLFRFKEGQSTWFVAALGAAGYSFQERSV